MPEAPPTYWDYLGLDRLLSLQEGLGDKPTSDELNFIIVHQAYELWFKLAIVEIRLARDEMGSERVPDEKIPYVVHHLRRVNEIFRLGVEQMRVMETLTPLDFLDFRTKLTPASGFQSFQMRELEILLGLEDQQRENLGKVKPLDYIKELADVSPAGAMAWGKISQARSETTLRESLHDWLYRTPIQGSTPDQPGDDAVVSGFIESYLSLGKAHRDEACDRLIEVGAGEPDKLRKRFAAAEANSRSFLMAEDTKDAGRIRRIRAAVLFIESYRELPLLAWPRLLLDTVVEMEEQLVLWRNRHARMVERTIGRRTGTGGSPGVAYLDKTSAYRIYPELWAVRAILNPRIALPELSDPAAYGFRG